jgi:hypothetical protein
VRPSFFATKVFGTLDSVQFSRARHPLPKIVNDGTSEVSLTGVTTHWTGWPTLPHRVEVMKGFGATKFCTWKSPPGVTEVVLLNLSRLEDRVAFLGLRLQSDSRQADAVEMVLRKAIPELMAKAGSMWGGGKEGGVPRKRRHL